jgi:hypothetical protein
MRQPRSYIIRIYRQGARTLTGVVEDTRTGQQRPFASVQDLWALLRRPSSLGPASHPGDKKPG